MLLNLVCGGLWAGITWFVREVAEMKKMELEAERLRKIRIERDKKQNDDEKAWFIREVEEMRRVGLAQTDEQSRGSSGSGREEKKDR